MDRIEVGTIALRMIARSVPSKQFDVALRLRASIVAALARAGITHLRGDVPTIDGDRRPAPHAAATT